MNPIEVLSGGNEEPGEPRRIPGVVTAIVTNNHDPEELNRVKLRFPWLSEEGETDWVRIATLMAGNGRGTVFLPEVGDEVLVGFEHGDIDYPYVLGALYSGADRPPERNSDGRNDRRVIESRNGHRIVFADDNGRDDQIRIETRNGNSVVLDDSGGNEGIEISTGGGHVVHLDDSSGRILIQDRAGNRIEGRNGRLDIRGDGSITIRAGTIRIRGRTVEIEASGVLRLKGGMVRIN